MDRRAPLLSTKLSYGVGSVAYGVKDNGFAFFLLLYYNQLLGLNERLVGLAIMLAFLGAHRINRAAHEENLARLARRAAPQA